MPDSPPPGLRYRRLVPLPAPVEAEDGFALVDAIPASHYVGGTLMVLVFGTPCALAVIACLNTFGPQIGGTWFQQAGAWMLLLLFAGVWLIFPGLILKQLLIRACHHFHLGSGRCLEARSTLGRWILRRKILPLGGASDIGIRTYHGTKTGVTHYVVVRPGGGLPVIDVASYRILPEAEAFARWLGERLQLPVAGKPGK